MRIAPPAVNHRSVAASVLWQTVPNMNEAQLQVIDTVHTTFIHSAAQHRRLYNPLDSGLGCLVARDQDQ